MNVNRALKQRPGGHTGGKFLRDHLDFFKVKALHVVARYPVPDQSPALVLILEAGSNVRHALPKFLVFG